MALITYLNRVHLEPGAITKLSDELKACGINRPLVVTDPGLANSLAMERVLAQCSAGAVVFHDTPQNPTAAAVAQAAALCRHERCDGIIALGGGSPIDLAKAAALLATHEGELIDFAFVNGGEARITHSVLPIIAVPTTAGTGSEVGRSAMIAFEDGRKLSFRSRFFFPQAAICDAELTLTLPARLTAATGMDAFTHCLETYFSPNDNPVAEAIAIRGAAIAFRHIETATADGTNLAARHQMMTAALMGGLAFQKGLGAVHAIAHQLSATSTQPLHHGTLNAVLLPPVIRHNMDHIHDKCVAVEQALGLQGGERLPKAIEALNRRIGMPPNLSAMGITRSDLQGVPEAAMRDASTRGNPRPMSAAGYAEILDSAF